MTEIDTGFSIATKNPQMRRVLAYARKVAATPYPVLGWEVADMEAAVAGLIANGVKMNVYEGLGQDARGIWTSPDGACKVAFFNDPDGNGLSLTQIL